VGQLKVDEITGWSNVEVVLDALKKVSDEVAV
jgi:hypothetical protein